VFESLVSAGAFDSLKDSRVVCDWRGALYHSIDLALSRAQRVRRERELGQTGLFGSTPEETDFADELPRTAQGWTQSELLAAEKAALGFYITGHPLEAYLELIAKVNTTRSSELVSLTSGTRVSAAGIVSDLQVKTTKKGDKFALLRLEDEVGGTKCVLWPEVFRKYGQSIHNETPVIISGRLELSEDSPPTIIVDQVQTMEAVSRTNEFVVLRTPQQADFAELFDAILHVLSSHPGDCDVAIETVVEDQTLVRIKTNPALRVKRSSELDRALTNLGCTLSIEKSNNGVRV
jgi:DNA polymerase III, alpha subunit